VGALPCAPRFYVDSALRPKPVPAKRCGVAGGATAYD
jgi:hypothetical protein